MLVLASASPRRQEILSAAGIPFTVRASGVDEVRSPEEAAVDYVQRLARHKAEAVLRPGEVVLGADTVVIVDDHVLEKPAYPSDAERMLRLLSGRQHQVITGICLASERHTVVDSETTLVRFVRLSNSEIEEYIASGEPFDKAGGYAIQGRASKFIDRIEGCYFNVVGLPVATVYRHWREFVSASHHGIQP